MADTVSGYILEALDNHTIRVSVDHFGMHNKFPYNRFETVIVEDKDTHHPLKSLRHFKVRCYIKYRDVYGRLHADIEIN